MLNIKEDALTILGVLWKLFKPGTVPWQSVECLFRFRLRHALETNQGALLLGTGFSTVTSRATGDLLKMMQRRDNELWRTPFILGFEIWRCFQSADSDGRRHGYGVGGFIRFYLYLINCLVHCMNLDGTISFKLIIHLDCLIMICDRS